MKVKFCAAVLFLLMCLPHGTVAMFPTFEDYQENDTLVASRQQDTVSGPLAGDSATVIRKYLVLRSRHKARRSKVIGEHKLIRVVTHEGKRIRGRLHLPDDSNVVLHNRFRKSWDTLKLADVRLINSISKGAVIMGALYLIMAPVTIGSGIYLMVEGYDYEKVIGVFLTGSGLGLIPVGFALLKGIARPLGSYEYHIYSARNFKLTSRMVKHLYP